MTPMNAKLLGIFMQENLGVLIVNRRLAERCRGSNSSGALGGFLAALGDELEDERRALEETMLSEGVRPTRLKNAILASSEKLGRLKRNGTLLSYSDLSRVYELHGLCLLTHHRIFLWHTLAPLPDTRVRAERLEARARQQLDALEQHRAAAAALLTEPA
ncbi:MAG TPA: hypothetical protein VFF07_06415 [Actinomycetota bacterium]|nr:hypothetical protein [Actinomycetota bacterium]